MPIYEFICDSCGYKIEVMQRITDPPLKECSNCSAQLRKQINTPAIVFKGSGWYVTDYPTKDRKEGMKKDNSTPAEKKKETNTEKAAV